ncbi:hypothetical protein KGM_212874 [Danaus plexippus plexippus]|uniref:Uncharacterized protein n=1 Tax=Danaus plexippus plexippus TaxID=278856 RepID=A0A212EZI0_DANPL|nr:hypothetical protein KGM_212874 [Danaus plexippus plexippus]
MNLLDYVHMIVDSLQDIRWIMDAAAACYPIAMMSKIHTA